MDDKSTFDELPISHLSNELNPDDEAFVLDWINFDDQNKQYFEQFKKVGKLLAIKQTVDNIDIADEWKHFKTAINKKEQEAYLDIELDGIVDNSLRYEQPKTKTSIYKIIISTAIAASVLFIMGVASVWMSRKSGSTLVVSNKKTTAVSSVRYEKNTSGTPKRLTLQDGTQIILSHKSEVSYPKPFTANSREIILKGSAYFKVAKDKTKPFTVFSGDISTTAFGTEFRVTAFESGKNIFVKLYEGKVVVKSSNTTKKKLKSEFYLLPGQEFVYNKVDMIGRIKSPRVINKVASKDNLKVTRLEKDNPSIPQLGAESWYMFNNQPLEQVFKQLEDLFKVKIVYSKKDISKIYFISRFRNSDSIDSIINQIARVNNFKVSKKKDKFVITKQQERL